MKELRMRNVDIRALKNMILCKLKYDEKNFIDKFSRYIFKRHWKAVENQPFDEEIDDDCIIKVIEMVISKADSVKLSGKLARWFRKMVKKHLDSDDPDTRVILEEIEEYQRKMNSRSILSQHTQNIFELLTEKYTDLRELKSGRQINREKDHERNNRDAWKEIEKGLEGKRERIKWGEQTIGELSNEKWFHGFALPFFLDHSKTRFYQDEIPFVTSEGDYNFPDPTEVNFNHIVTLCHIMRGYTHPSNTTENCDSEVEMLVLLNGNGYEAKIVETDDEKDILYCLLSGYKIDTNGRLGYPDSLIFVIRMRIDLPNDKSIITVFFHPASGCLFPTKNKGLFVFGWRFRDKCACVCQIAGNDANGNRRKWRHNVNACIASKFLQSNPPFPHVKCPITVTCLYSIRDVATNL